jgi:AcrR family transcriptional regulator
MDSSLLGTHAGPFSARQEQVLDVVEAAFLRQGIRAVRMAQLSDEASCSRSTLYELAPSKEALLLLVVDRVMRRITARGAEAIEHETRPAEQIRAMLTSGAVDFGALGPRFLEAVREHPPTRMLFDRWVARGLVVLQQLIEDAVSVGEFRPVNAGVIAEAIFGVVLRFTDPEVIRSGNQRFSDRLAETVDVLLDGLRPRSTPPHGGTGRGALPASGPDRT